MVSISADTYPNCCGYVADASHLAGHGPQASRNDRRR